jgi:hypothetical protein
MGSISFEVRNSSSGKRSGHSAEPTSTSSARANSGVSISAGMLMTVHFDATSSL